MYRHFKLYMAGKTVETSRNDDQTWCNPPEIAMLAETAQRASLRLGFITPSHAYGSLLSKILSALTIGFIGREIDVTAMC